MGLKEKRARQTEKGICILYMPDRAEVKATQSTKIAAHLSHICAVTVDPRSHLSTAEGCHLEPDNWQRKLQTCVRSCPYISLRAYMYAYICICISVYIFLYLFAAYFPLICQYTRAVSFSALCDPSKCLASGKNVAGQNICQQHNKAKVKGGVYVMRIKQPKAGEAGRQTVRQAVWRLLNVL